jgi:hypothetical protein
MHHAIIFLAGVFSAIGADNSRDIRSVAADLQVPTIEAGPAAPGKRVNEVLPEYANTKVHHVTYLPTDWRPGMTYPVIAEYAGNGGYKNKYGDITTGRVEDSNLGYGISAGRGFIWVCLPCLNDKGTGNVTKWWGNPPEHNPRATINYCRKVIPWICAKYGGDPNRVVLTGFSRGAIACNFIGLHDSEIAKLWCAFAPFSHYDGVVEWEYKGSDRAAALVRLKLLGDRPQFICAEEGLGGHSVSATKAYLDATGVRGDFTFRTTGFRNHDDQWILRPSKARDELRRWVAAVVK